MVWMLDGKSTVILDTGCRTAVAGALWHRKFQEELLSRNLPWEEVPHEEVFRFGAGAPVVSTKAMLYPVALGNSGALSWLRLALVENTASDPRVEQCPALIGPSELARWDITFDFANRKLTVKGQPQEMELSHTRHPVLTMVEDGRSFAEWKTPALGRAEGKADERSLQPGNVAREPPRP